jgi:hypothetical protein
MFFYYKTIADVILKINFWAAWEEAFSERQGDSLAAQLFIGPLFSVQG